MGETSKAHDRRVRENWYAEYIQTPGIDIGCQHDPVDEHFRKYDVIFGDGDATLMADVPDDSYKTVYASHVLEHLADPIKALRNWYRILRPGGYLLVSVPHRDLYEKKLNLPSRWNGEHKTFWLPVHPDNLERHTKGLCNTIILALFDHKAELMSLRVCDDGYQRFTEDVHSQGEYSIEAIVRKPG